MASLDGCNGSCNTIDDWSSGICVSKKTDDVYLNIFNMTTTTTTTTTNESKTLKKHNSCNCKCKFHGRKCISNQKRN